MCSHSTRFILSYVKILLRNGMLLSFLVRHSGLVLLVAFGLASLWVLGDYGVSSDEGAQRNIAIKTIDYVFGYNDALYADHNKFYGTAFELPLLLTERALGLEDNRDIFLMRHLLTHLFFLTGGFFCYLLAYRLFENRLLAVLAMLLFLLHPRLYAHSFFNTKDIPFLSMFMICLYLTHRAFGRGCGWWWFAALGIGTGLLINLRIMGATMFLAVLAMQLLDLIQSDDNGDRTRVLTKMAVFMLSSLLTVYVSIPYLWSDPIGRSMEWFHVLSQHPNVATQLFRGDIFRSSDVHPPEYVPIWFSITTSPTVLVLGLVGIATVLCRGVVHIGDVFRNTQLRFGFLLVGCFILPIVAVIVLSSNVYNGWRQMYFLYAPFCLLAVFGIHCMIPLVKGGHLRPGVYSLIVAGMAVVVVSMVSIHPHQHVYFNFMVDRTTPEHLRHQYDMDYWGASLYEASEFLLERYPSSDISVRVPHRHIGGLNRWILPASDRSRVSMNNGAGDFLVTNYRDSWSGGGVLRDVPSSSIYNLKIYGSTVLTVTDLSDVDDELVNAYMDIYRRKTSKGEHLIRGEFDIYLDDYNLVYVKDDCVASDVELEFFLHMEPPVSDVPVPEENNRLRAERFNFDFYQHGIMSNDICVAIVPVPWISFNQIFTGQWNGHENAWEGIYLATADDARYTFQAFQQNNNSEPLIRSVFEIYIDDGDRLIYVKEQCSTEDVDTTFFLHVRPADMSDLPERRRELGYDNLDFNLREHGGETDGNCFAVMELPAYEIASISTGQFTSKGRVWSSEYNASIVNAVAATREFLEKGVQPAVRSVFDVYIDDGKLVYTKSPCTDEDHDARFFLHLTPADVSDLSAERRESGFDNLDFNLWEHGGESDGACFAAVDLPAYDIARIYTGQFTAVGHIWSEEFETKDE